MFILDEKLQQDSFLVGELELCKLLLMNDANYPWLILVPKKNNLREIIDLNFDEQVLLLREINFVAKILQQEFSCDKLNIANLGNVVAQLHVHVIARNKGDACFPRPVWGSVTAIKYNEEQSLETLAKIQKHLK